jgi:hypothetical protein
LLRRILVLVILSYLAADYCDPSVPGVFWFGTESFFVESTEARPAMPVLASPAIRAVLPDREALEPIAPRMVAAAPPRVRVVRQSPRSYAALSPSSVPEPSDDH